MKRFFGLFLGTFILINSGQLFAQQYTNYTNTNDSLEFRKVRITLIPPVSTNGIKAPKYSARYSLNIIGGYHGGLDGYEIGGIFNITKEYAFGFQFAGITNFSLGDMAGVNLAGGFNYAGDDMSGIQLAGLANIAGDELTGIQVASGINFSKDRTTGIQVAGLGNASIDELQGLQASGIFNATYNSISGLQAAGVFNLAKEDVQGLQAAGVFNFAGRDISGLQASGFSNIALGGNIEGLFASGFLNYAKGSASGLFATGGINIASDLEGLAFAGIANTARNIQGLMIAPLNFSSEATGVQIGILNIAREFNGASVGILSIYGNGRQNIDMRYSDAGFADFTITTGTHRVYNMAILGYNTALDRNVYRIGIGVGLEKNIEDVFPSIKSNSLFVNQEFTVLHHFEENWSGELNWIYSYRYLFGKRFGSGLSVYGGPSLNAQVTRAGSGTADYTWYSFWSPEWKDRDYRFWIGFTVGIRVFKQKNLPLLNIRDEDWRWDW